MYVTHYECFYNDDKKMFSGKEDLTENAKLEIKDFIYREDLINAFGLEEFDERLINIEIENLYEKMSHLTVLDNILDTLAAKMMSTDRSLGFLILFSYDYFYLTHQIICEFLENNTINDDKVAELTSVVNK
jgi:hypothetical protein